MKKITLLSMIVLVMLCRLSFASDIAREVRSAGAEPLIVNGGYLEIGFGGVVANNGLEKYHPVDSGEVGAGYLISVSGEYRYHGFFVEATHGSFDGANLGFTLWHNDTWQLDLLGASLSGELNLEVDDVEEGDDEEERNSKLVLRDTFYNGAGVRLTGYLANHIFQYRLVADSFSSNGVVSTARIGRHWQWRNWNLHAVLGLAYASEKTNRYWFGVAAEDASMRFPAYNPGASVTLEAETGVAYPISENWVFRSFLRYKAFPDEVSNSPLVHNSYAATLNASVSYVF